MSFRTLLSRFSTLFKQYKEANDTGTGIQVVDLTIGTVKSAFRSMAIDTDLKTDKISECILIYEYLDKIIENKEKPVDEKVIIDVLNYFKRELEKIETLRAKKQIRPGDLDGLLTACREVIQCTLVNWSTTGLKDAKESEIEVDPRLILEECLLDYLVGVDLQKWLKQTPKSLLGQLSAVFSMTGSESFDEGLSKHVREIISDLDIMIKDVKKGTPQYYLNVLKFIDSTWRVEHSERQKHGETDSALMQLLKNAEAKIHSLSGYKEAQLVIDKEKKEKLDEADASVHKLIATRYEQVKEETRRKEKEEEAKRKVDAEVKKKADEEAKRKAEAEAKKKAEEEAKKKAEETKKKQEEEAAAKKGATPKKEDGKGKEEGKASAQSYSAKAGAASAATDSDDEQNSPLPAVKSPAKKAMGSKM